MYAFAKEAALTLIALVVFVGYLAARTVAWVVVAQAAVIAAVAPFVLIALAL